MDFLDRVTSATLEWRCKTSFKPRYRFVESLWRGWRERGLAIIGEFKRCAPGRFVGLHEPWEYAKKLAPYVDAFSVLTEPFWFCGSPALIPLFAQHRPVLAKDFTVCTGMLAEFADAGASAVLLILDQLGWRRLDELYSEARSMDLDALIETSSWRDAVEVASSYPEAAVGINARNLRTLELSFEKLLDDIRKAADRIGEKTMLVAESSVDAVEKALVLKDAGAKAVLVGTWFMRDPDAARRLSEELAKRVG
ncbi:Indole-3-glycerol-phosphate synthase [Pyrolobus fumarii 1A]|uniref:indole-3-glycerol-phosphate synthase n=1 Tax=Pyrolobus fumarii (strain DSM 11204 / 1A) TaxID=694429 RepID=G0EGV3_PYRF1|nr:indole-3-glycerol-phosphate synthase [Pyrolobus fumarii]AEM39251.1 Indole-3-glycerol-phosphate synthase [Pyrolobus fumarii 1A]